MTNIRVFQSGLLDDVANGKESSAMKSFFNAGTERRTRIKEQVLCGPIKIDDLRSDSKAKTITITISNQTDREQTVVMGAVLYLGNNYSLELPYDIIVADQEDNTVVNNSVTFGPYEKIKVIARYHVRGRRGHLFEVDDKVIFKIYSLNQLCEYGIEYTYRKSEVDGETYWVIGTSNYSAAIGGDNNDRPEYSSKENKQDGKRSDQEKKQDDEHSDQKGVLANKTEVNHLDRKPRSIARTNKSNTICKNQKMNVRFETIPEFEDKLGIIIQKLVARQSKEDDDEYSVVVFGEAIESRPKSVSNSDEYDDSEDITICLDLFDKNGDILDSDSENIRNFNGMNTFKVVFSLNRRPENEIGYIRVYPKEW